LRKRSFCFLLSAFLPSSNTSPPTIESQRGRYRSAVCCQRVQSFLILLEGAERAGVRVNPALGISQCPCVCSRVNIISDMDRASRMPRHSYQLTHILFSGEMKADHIRVCRRPTRSILHSIDSAVQLLSRVQFIRNRRQQRNRQSTAADRGCCRLDTAWGIVVLLFLNSLSLRTYSHTVHATGNP
jgi:hypothetical protein